MRLLCVCPTFGRPTLLANSIALFEAQNYPKTECKLLILDDACQYKEQKGVNWEIRVAKERFESMPRKYRALFHLESVFNSDVCEWDAIVMWDDDDIYLPNHLSAHAQQLVSFKWSHPKRVYCCYEPITIEKVGGNMWASCAFRTAYLRSFDMIDWFDNKKAAFDLEFLGKMSKTPAGQSDELSFMFRWGSTHAPHLQGFIQSPDDLEAYKKFPQHETQFVERMQPRFDRETERILGKYRLGLLPT